MSRRTTILRSTIALVAACALAACAMDPEPEAAAELEGPVPARRADADAPRADIDAPRAGTAAPRAGTEAPRAGTDIRSQIAGTRELVVAGERLNAEALRHFYARHGYEPVWTTRQAQATSLVDAVLRAGDQGLDPELFHASLLRHRAALPPLEQELLLSDAFLSYGSALAFGAVPVDRRRDDEVLAPQPVDVASVLDVAIGSPDPGAVIEALAPTTPTYLALRQALQSYRSGTRAIDRAGDPPGPQADDTATTSYVRTIAIRVEHHGGPTRQRDAVQSQRHTVQSQHRTVQGQHRTVQGQRHAVQSQRYTVQRHRAAAPTEDTAGTDRLRTIEVNLERQRWLPRPLPADRVWVNVADEQLVFYRANQPVFSTRIVVGEDVVKNQSPEFSTLIDASLYNPPWVIPSDIVKNEIAPKIASDPGYLTRNHMILLPNGEAEQLPGPDAGLGLLMFDMPNRFDVYLHDTPDRDTIFKLANRRISHGCIRVQNPREFAALLMQQPIETINQGIAVGGTTRHALPTPVPVFVVYQTASTGADGKLQFYPDFYSRDAEIWRKLQSRPPERDHVAQADDRLTSPTSF
jgi:murein L,D-transpeptidase YcbB/YkuD